MARLVVSGSAFEWLVIQERTIRRLGRDGFTQVLAKDRSRSHHVASCLRSYAQPDSQDNCLHAVRGQAHARHIG